MIRVSKITGAVHNRAVREVLSGSLVGEVALRYGTSRQSVHTWRAGSRRGVGPGAFSRQAARSPLARPDRLPAGQRRLNLVGSGVAKLLADGPHTHQFFAQLSDLSGERFNILAGGGLGLGFNLPDPVEQP